MDTIMLFNATGMQGSTIAGRLQSAGFALVTPTRSAENLPTLHEQGFHGFTTDFSVEHLAPEIEKVNQVVLQIPAQVSPEVMVRLCENCLRAIRQAGSPRTIFVISSTVPETPTGKTSADARLRMKTLAREILPDCVILSATEYLENFSTSYRGAIEHEGMIPQTIPAHLPVNYLSWNDLAEYVTAVVGKTELPPGFYPIGGNEGISGEQLAARLGTIIGKELRYHTLTHQQLEGFLTPIVGQPLAGELAEFYEWQDLTGSHLLNPDTTALRKELGIELPGFEDWARNAFEKG